MNGRKIPSLFFLIALLFSSLVAGTIPGRWEKVDSLQRGTRVVVKLKSEDRIDGFFQSSDPESVLLLRPDGKEMRLPKSGVQEIVRPKPNDILNGAVLGAGIGAASFLIGHAVICCAPSEEHDLYAALFSAGIGLGIGALVDRGIKGKETLYVAP